MTDQVGTPNAVRTGPTSGLFALEPGDIIAEKYRIEALLGRGAMGVVVAAHHELIDRPVAIKLIADTTSEKRLERFVREARSAQSLESEHVVRVFDLGVEQGTPYLVMERLDGEDLGARLERDGPLSVTQAVDLVLQACEGLAEAHASGIIHRDIKPSNLIVTTRRNGDPLLKIVDFGISKELERKQTDASLTASVTVLGSPLYMSPEQIRNPKDIDQRTDVWSLAVTLYTLITGSPPFPGDHVSAVCAAIVADPPVPLPESVPADLQAALHAALQKRPENRIGSVSEFAGMLHNVASDLGRLSADRVARLYPADLPHPPSEKPELGLTQTDERTRPTLPRSAAEQSMADAPVASSVQPPRRSTRWPVVVAGLVGIAAGGLVVKNLAVTNPAAEPNSASEPSAETGSNAVNPAASGSTGAVSDAAAPRSAPSAAASASTVASSPTPTRSTVPRPRRPSRRPDNITRAMPPPPPTTDVKVDTDGIPIVR